MNKDSGQQGNSWLWFLLIMAPVGMLAFTIVFILVLGSLIAVVEPEFFRGILW